MTRHLTLEHEQGISGCVKTKPKKIWNDANMKNKSTEPPPALQLTNGTYATTDNNKAETLNTFFSSIFTKETRGDRYAINQHVNKTSDDISITTEKVLKE